MPDFPIIDTHWHLWDPQYISYPWLRNLPRLNRRFLIEDYQKSCGSVEVNRLVFIQCEADFAHAMREFRWVAELAEKEPRIKGIVPWAPLEKGKDCLPVLETLAANPLVKGVRRMIQGEEDPEFCLQAGFLEGVRLLPRFNLTFDICISHFQMGNTSKLVQHCPEVRFVLDHIGKPDIRNRVYEPWRSELRVLAGLPNVHCKMSGLVVEAQMETWTPQDLRPYIDYVFECFGFDRVMFGGDWPVVLLASEMEDWIRALDRALEGVRQDDVRKLYRDNAIAFYRLDEQ